MTEIAYVFNDAGLTDPFDDATDTLDAQAVNGASGYGVFYVGSADDTIKFRRQVIPALIRSRYRSVTPALAAALRIRISSCH